MECFVEVCRRRDLKGNADKSNVMVLVGEEGLEYEISVEGTQLEKVSEFKYLRCVLEESGTYVAECRRRVVSGRKVASSIRSLVVLGVCSFSALGCWMRLCTCLFCCMAVGKLYGENRKGL